MRTKDPFRSAEIRTQAMELVVAEGLDGFSMHKLARAAGVSPATLYVHFQDRDDLLFQLYRERKEAFAEAALEGFDPDQPFAEGLRVQWRNRLAFARRDPLGWRYLDILSAAPCHGEYARRLDPRFFQAMGRFSDNARARGEIADFPGPGGDFCVPLFWSLAYAPLHQLIQYEQGFDGPGVHGGTTHLRIDEAVFETAFQAVLRAVARPRPGSFNPE